LLIKATQPDILSCTKRSSQLGIYQVAASLGAI